LQHWQANGIKPHAQQNKSTSGIPGYTKQIYTQKRKTRTPYPTCLLK